MIVNLFCPRCTIDAIDKGQPFPEVPVPISRLSDDGKYEVRCANGHQERVVLSNLKFELLFEMGIQAILDGYYREAVSSFAVALERFYEFYSKVVFRHKDVSQSAIDEAWKSVARQSERQLGMFMAAHLVLSGKAPILLNPNKEARFRNDVIHKGYVPRQEEAMDFGDVVLELINEPLNDLRQLAGESLFETYDLLSPASQVSEDDDVGITNILTAVDARFPPKPGDKRIGKMKTQISRVADNRIPHKMAFLKEEEFRNRFPNKRMPRYPEDYDPRYKKG